MLQQLTLTNFRQHSDLTINFGGGLQALRGANEAGKSTILWAVAYAFYGSRALPLPFSEIVTWGQPESSLKVRLEFSHDNSTYTITRSKSGAELVGPNVTASGQAEVTNFVERLFKAPMQVALATMLCNQSELQGGLNSTAMPLIEKLANMSLIDDVISKIQANLPSGNTKALSNQYETLAALKRPTLDLTALEADLVVNNQLVESAKYAVSVCQAQLVDAQEAASQQASVEQRNSSKESMRASLQQREQALSEAIQVDIVEPAQAVEQLLKQQAAYNDYNRVKSVWEDFQDTELPAKRFQGSYTALVSELGVQESVKSAAAEAVTNLRVQIAQLQAQLITQTACGLCGKNLADVPEVVEKNDSVNARIENLKSEHAQQSAVVQKATERITELKALQRVANGIRAVVERHADLLAEQGSTTPGDLVWIGPAMDSEPPAAVTDQQVQACRTAWANHSRAVARQAAAVAELENVRRMLSEDFSLEVVPAEVLKRAAALETLQANLQVLTSMQRQAEAVLSANQTTIAVTKARHEEALRAWEESQVQLQSLRATLNQINFNNTLIERLREVRPIVARELWALVLTGVSHYFSLIRGQMSTVTRGDNGFVIDGRPAAAFSGSTKDSLGLAIRIMLQKTFLPSVSFMLVDEPGAAFDDTRESDMLGVLSSIGIDQVVLVTHSDLADTFAANVIQL